MKKEFHKKLYWEIYKFLSRSEINDYLLDLYYCLTYYFFKLEKGERDSKKLFDLLDRALTEDINIAESTLQKYINIFKLTKIG